MDYIVKAYKDWKLHSQFQEIVPDMDDEFMFNEKQSIRESARSLKKYGSTCCNNIRNNETLIRHNVEKTDTLQGIALKYGCTTEQIRRANRLFASDSLFLRQFLLIPVEKTSPYYPTQPSTDANINGSDMLAPSNITPISDDYNINDMVHTTIPTPLTTSVTATDLKAFANITHSNNSPRTSNNLPQRPYSIAGELLIQTNDDDPAVLMNSHHNSSSSNSSSSSSGGSSSSSGGCSGSSASSSGNKQSKSLDSVAAMSPEEENRKCINDFLNKIDTTISESRKYVEKSREMLTARSDDDDLFVINADIVERRRNNNLNSSYKNNNNNNSSSGNNNNNKNTNNTINSRHQRHSSNGSGTSDTAQLLNTTQLRRVQNSMKRLEKQQDEIFEL